MSSASTIILVPFLFAFLMFCIRFYFKEGAYSKLRPSFLLALATIVMAVTYLYLAVTRMLPDYGAAGFLCVGLVLLGLAVYRMFTI